ncbi:hypothetical protein Srufu_024120 [Streptomyces libani subsp. rufus]|nr:hypothetical protein Srufu_024120 [Streptomyces libani subsp. rufus]
MRPGPPDIPVVARGRVPRAHPAPARPTRTGSIGGTTGRGRESTDPPRRAIRQPSESGQERPCPHPVRLPWNGYKGQNPAKHHKPR